MAITVTSSRLPISPDVAIPGVYAMVPRNSVAYLPGDSSWSFEIRYFLSIDVRKAEKVYEYFRSLDEKPAEWSDAKWAKAQSVRNIQVSPVFTIGTHTTDALGVVNPTDVDDALSKIYVWVKANCEPGAQDVLDDTTTADLVAAYFISAGV